MFIYIYMFVYLFIYLFIYIFIYIFGICDIDIKKNKPTPTFCHVRLPQFFFCRWKCTYYLKNYLLDPSNCSKIKI